MRLTINAQVTALGSFHPDPSLAKILITGSIVISSPKQHFKDDSLECIWNLLDYGWLSDSTREVSMSESHSGWSPGADAGIYFIESESNDLLQSNNAPLPQSSSGAVIDLPVNTSLHDGPDDLWSEILQEGGDIAFPSDKGYYHVEPTDTIQVEWNH